MPNDAKTKLDRDTHLLQDQPTTADPVREAPKAPHDGNDDPVDAPEQRQPLQAQQRDVTGKTPPAPDGTIGETDSKSHDGDYGAKTGAAEDHPYSDDRAANDKSVTRRDEDKSAPPDNHTEVNSEADLDDPSDR